jgi:hypothetical protein
MADEKFHDIPAHCPITGEPLYVSELTSEKSGIVIRGKFHVPRAAGLDADQQKFLEVFLRARGVISTMEKELGISYPTVRARVDSLLHALNLEPYKNEKRDEHRAETKRQILQQLESGEITPQEAKQRLKRTGTE